MKIGYLALGLIMATASCASQPERVNTIVKTPLGVQVVPPKCPDWTKASGGDFENKPSSNFGCSTITNYGVMVENPEDMIKGHNDGYTNGATSARAVSAYEAGAASSSSAAPGWQ